MPLEDRSAQSGLGVSVPAESPVTDGADQADGAGVRPQRVRITHPRTEAVRRPPRTTVTREIDEQTELGDVYMTSLIRSQRRLALSVSMIVALLLAGVALAGALAPGFARQHVFGVPAPWLVLGLLIYPALIGLGWFTVRTTERTERHFTEMVRRQ